MDSSNKITPLEDNLHEQLISLEPTERQRIIRKIIMAALGSIPWVGGFLTAAQAYNEDKGQTETDVLQRQWLEEHRLKMQNLARDLAEIIERLDSIGDEINSRIESEQYLALVRKSFRAWDQADTEQKKKFIKRIGQCVASFLFIGSSFGQSHRKTFQGAANVSLSWRRGPG
jgi:hypothetical protein